MSLNADDVIKNMETSAVKLFTDKAVTALVGLWAPLGWPVIGPVIAYLVGIVVGVLATYTDWLSFMLLDGWKNTVEAKSFEAASEKVISLPSDATPEDKAKAEQDQIDAFQNLISLGSPPPP